MLTRKWCPCTLAGQHSSGCYSDSDHCAFLLYVSFITFSEKVGSVLIPASLWTPAISICTQSGPSNPVIIAHSLPACDSLDFNWSQDSPTWSEEWGSEEFPASHTLSPSSPPLNPPVSGLLYSGLLYTDPLLWAPLS